MKDSSRRGPDRALPRPGSHIAGRYQLLLPIGRGGMGIVYAARDTDCGRTVAIKRLHESLLDDDAVLARFEREAHTAAAAGDEHVVQVLDVGREPTGAPYLVMELVRGVSLEERLRTDGPLDVEHAVDVAVQVLRALEAVHARGVVHRDLKPGNVLLTVHRGRQDFVKLLDFGVAAFIDELRGGQELTPPGRAMGTPDYASPEQLRGGDGRDARCDLYGVGILLYESLAGHRPFVHDDYLALVDAILHEEPTPLRAYRKDVPEALEQVIRRALAKRPERRYPDAGRMYRALVGLGATAPADATPDQTGRVEPDFE